MTKAPSQQFALVVGIAYVLIGVVGFFVTGFSGFVADGDKALLGFDLNGFHNVVHLGIGAMLIAVSMVDDVSITQGVLIGGGLVYVLAAFLGFTNNLQLLSIDGSMAPDNFLHIGSGVLAIIFGLIGGEGSTSRASTGP